MLISRYETVLCILYIYKSSAIKVFITGRQGRRNKKELVLASVRDTNDLAMRHRRRVPFCTIVAG